MRKYEEYHSILNKIAMKLMRRYEECRSILNFKHVHDKL